MKNLLLVFIGGGLGSVLRYMISKYLNADSALPFGTFTVNVLGSLLIGFVLGWAIRNDQLNSSTTLLIGVGLCGGFTTFSTFSYENFSLLKSGEFYTFFIYLFSSLIFGILSVFIGLSASKLI